MIFTLTPALVQGGYAGPGRVPDLVTAGVTHILNVCESPSEVRPEDGPFTEVVWRPLADSRRLTDAEALETLDVLHRMVCQPDSVTYVHCVAGWIRSPTIVWLYLLACGVEQWSAARGISARNPSSRAGNVDIVDQALLNFVRAHGQANYLPHPRPEALRFI